MPKTLSSCPWCSGQFESIVDRERHMMIKHAEKYFGGSDYTHIHA